MRTNVAAPRSKVRTAEGAPAARIKPTQQLRRLVLSCLLWEDEFYVDGKTIAAQIDAAAHDVPIEELAALCVEARSQFNLRHVPLHLLTTLIARGRGNPIVASTIQGTIQRADELSELLAMYWKDGKRPLSGQLKRGLGLAFQKFNAYSLAKYNRDNAVKLRDVLFMVHPKPLNNEQEATWKLLAENQLPAPDTWEVALSAGADKKATFERLMAEGQLGYLAVLRNLRNMEKAGVDDSLIRDTILARKGAQRVLPFRYVAAARAAKQYEPVLDEALCMAIDGLVPLPGKTIVLVDVSGSMDAPLSQKSDLTRLDAAATLASIIPGQLRVFTFSHQLVEVPPRRGMAGVDAVIKSQPHGGTYLGQAMAEINKIPHDRVIVITDEQSHDSVPTPMRNAYMINVASNKNGIGYGPKWKHLDGFSENILRFIGEIEQ